MNIELLKYTFNDRIAASKIGAYIRNSGITVQGLPDGTVYVETSMMPAEVYMPFEPKYAPTPAEQSLRERFMAIMNSANRKLTIEQRTELRDIISKKSELVAKSDPIDRALSDADDAAMMKKALAYNIGNLPKQLDDIVERLYSEGKVRVELYSASGD